MDTTWDWFCGANSSNKNATLNWYSDVRNNTCLVDGLVTIPHAAFLLLASLILLILGCCTSYCRVHTKYLLTYPGHSLRWLVSVLLLIVILASIGEGIMTDETYQAWHQPTQPHLYLHGIIAFVAVIISLIYYHHMELWQLPNMSVLLLIYWTFSACNEGLHLLSLQYKDLIDVNILLFDLAIVKLVIYIFFIILEINVTWTELCSCCHSADGFPDDLKLPDMKYMHYNVSFLSSLTYWWANWLLTLGYKKHLDLADLGVVPLWHQAKSNHERFRKVFRQEAATAKRLGKQLSLLKVYTKVYGRRMFVAGLMKMMGEMSAFIGPLAVGTVTVYVERIYAPTNGQPIPPPHLVKVTDFFRNGFVLVFIMFLGALGNSVGLQMNYFMSNIEGMNVGAAIQAVVYEKSLRLSTVAMSSGEMNIGQITNHMSIDQDAVQYMFQFITSLCVAPIQLTVNLLLLYFMMGFSGLLGASLFLIATPVQIKIAQYMGRQQKKLMGYSDERLKKTNELLQGIKLLKLYAWEELYCNAIEVIRGKELRLLYKINTGYFTTLLLTFAVPVFVMVLGFGTYTTFTDETLNPEVTFTALALFNMIFVPLVILPTCLLLVINGVISTRRLAKFLAAPEISKEITTGWSRGDAELNFQSPSRHGDGQQSHSSSENEYDGSADTERSRLVSSDGHHGYQNKHKKKRGYESVNPKHQVLNIMKRGVAVKISNGSFLWDPASGMPALSDINLEIPEGKLTIVIGQVGSGKSSLLAAILGEMTTVNGTVQIRDRNQIALAAQKPWLLNGTLQDNILFSQPLNSKRYQRVLNSCALKFDIDILPAGDQTEIGEKGINLSGGQKQRVSVARAMYSGRDIIILDDPLSALDVHVGSQLFTAGIQKFLLSHRQTVILVTHQLQYLNRADLIIKMEEGRIAAQGTLDDIIAVYPDMYTEYNQAVKMSTESEMEAGMSGYESESMKEDRLILQKQVKTEKHQAKGTTKDASGSLIAKEEMERGSVSWRFYFYYVRNFGLPVALLAVSLSGIYAGLNIQANFWLSEWAESGLGNYTNPNSQVDEFLGIFVAYEFGYLVSRCLSFAVVIWGLMRAAKRLHQKMLRNIIRVPLRFFDTVPVGRILNRFSNDTGLIDVKITQTFLIVIASSLNTISAVVVNSIVMPIFLAFFIPVAIGFFFLQRYFLASSRELQRLNSTSKSPILAYFSESITGLTTIRAYKAGGRFYEALMGRINNNLSAFMYLQVVLRWVGIRLDFLGATTVLLAGLASLIGALLFDLTPSLAGLAIAYSLQVSQFLNALTRTMAEAEMQMNGVERVKYYTSVPNETYEGLQPRPNWPQRGLIQMANVSVRYASDTEAVLRDISVVFKAGEKIGICGRTGAGKSSLTLALLRVIEIFQGRILIDGVDIMSVPLTTLRSQLSIIPQDPILFTGTIRRNLDPLSPSANTDEDLWHALEIAQLKDVVSALDGGLEFMVTEGGENFSVGQRQLFCLARAFLRKSRILIMDEATASMDLQTDKTLQRVVEMAFAERTVLTIAHRITTILNADNILVLDEGRIAEYGPPDDLMQQDGIFASFVRNNE